MEVAVIGGGAAGFFAAISCKEHYPDAQVTIYEKTGKLLSKVLVSGGGRCNVTNACFNINQLVKHYPRGGNSLKKSFVHFNTSHTVNWFEKRNVKLKAEPDNRMFPVTDNSQTIVNCLINEAKKAGITICLNSTITSIEKEEDLFLLHINGKQKVTINKLIIATGGNPKKEGFEWLERLGHQIEPPVPSLFTFNMPGESIKELMGVVVDPVSVKVEGTKLKQEGPLLITHWGMSGPAILKLSAWGARILFDLDYQFKVHINWLHDKNEQEVFEVFKSESTSKRKFINNNPFGLPARLWSFLLSKSEINAENIWLQTPKKNLNRLMNFLINDVYEVKGKTTFKEEFVTCGGVSLQNVSMDTMQSKICKGLYFAGEVLDIDGVTGGFNFQAAWTTGYLAGRLGD